MEEKSAKQVIDLGSKEHRGRMYLVEELVHSLIYLVALLKRWLLTLKLEQVQPPLM